MRHSFVNQVLLKMSFPRMSIAAELCGSWAGKSCPAPACSHAHGYKHVLTLFWLGYRHKHIQAIYYNRFDIKCSYRKGIFFFYSWCRLRIHAWSFLYRVFILPNRQCRVANRVCKYKTPFSIENYNKIANVSFVPSSKSW